MKHYQKALILAPWLLLSGCANHSINLKSLNPFSTQDIDRSQLYLTGVFTWWEFESAYKVVPLDGDRYQVTTDLIADGQPYGFKFADESWSNNNNCGANSAGKTVTIKLGETVSAYCGADSGNFSFVPKQSGHYQFIINFADDTPSVTIKKI